MISPHDFNTYIVISLCGFRLDMSGKPIAAQCFVTGYNHGELTIASHPVALDLDLVFETTSHSMRRCLPLSSCMQCASLVGRKYGTKVKSK